MKLQRQWYDLVEAGQKTVEGRLGRRDFKVGDTITFECGNDVLNAIISNIWFYDSFEKMLEYHLKEALPGYNFEEGLKVYTDIYNEKIKENESIVVMAIGFNLVK